MNPPAPATSADQSSAPESYAGICPLFHRMTSLRRATHGTDASREFHTRASPPPGRSTRPISLSASAARNQWKACATVTQSTDASANGSASAVPSRTSTPGTTSTSFARMASTGSTAMILAPVGTSSRVSLPVPAARSTTVDAGPMPSSRTTKLTTAGGYDGRARS